MALRSSQECAVIQATMSRSKEMSDSEMSRRTDMEIESGSTLGIASKPDRVTTLEPAVSHASEEPRSHGATATRGLRGSSEVLLDSLQISDKELQARISAVKPLTRKHWLYIAVVVLLSVGLIPVGWQMDNILSKSDFHFHVYAMSVVAGGKNRVRALLLHCNGLSYALQYPSRTRQSTCWRTVEDFTGLASYFPALSMYPQHPATLYMYECLDVQLLFFIYTQVLVSVTVSYTYVYYIHIYTWRLSVCG